MFLDKSEKLTLSDTLSLTQNKPPPLGRPFNKEFSQNVYTDNIANNKLGHIYVNNDTITNNNVCLPQRFS